MQLNSHNAWGNIDLYKQLYNDIKKNQEAFWMEQIKDITWIQKPTKILDNNTWFKDGIASVCYNCVDRHAQSNQDKPAIIWHGDEYCERTQTSYQDLKNRIIQIATALKQHDIKKGDVVGIYMPMLPDAIASMLACSRICAIHMVVFAGFSHEALSQRLKHSNAKIIITVTQQKRGGRTINLIEQVQKATKSLQIPILNLDELKTKVDDTNDQITYQTDQDELFHIYTSGSTGTPKKITHTAIPYLIYAATTFKYIFDIKPNDIYFCTSDIGWITGHSYITYAPLFHGLTTVIFSGSPTYPEADRYWDIIEKEKVTIFYTAPTAIRSLQMFDEKLIKQHDISSLRILGSVGEPLNESAWNWMFNKIGKQRCPIMNTWWQTETGGIMISPLLNLEQNKTRAGLPFFGIDITIEDQNGKPIEEPNNQGMLKIKSKWPGMCKNIQFKNKEYSTGDGSYYDEHGHIKITGRLDDVINISGHRLGTAEFESAINLTDNVIESAVIGIPHELKGQTAFAFVVAKQHIEEQQTVQQILNNTRKNIGPIAKPDYVLFVNELPKNRSGKINRKLLTKIYKNEPINSSDTHTLINPDIINHIQKKIKEAIFCPDICRIKANKNP
ncbi:MAG: acetate--CoA ligase [Alphaproteobacteria bacterium]|nr:acetate--CoA ligase [Alphaproteobacteria bacterium]